MRISNIVTICLSLSLSACAVATESASEAVSEEVDAGLTPVASEEPLASVDGERSLLGYLCAAMRFTQNQREEFCRKHCPKKGKDECWSAAYQGRKTWTNFCATL